MGFDGATFDLIRPWAEAGFLPTFCRLMRQGAWGDLESTAPPVTPVAWSTLATGLNPGKHGVFDFFMRESGSYATRVGTSADRHGAAVWDLLGQAGYRSTVFNVPATYPPDRVNGLMVSGVLTPNDAVDASWPPELLSELKKAVPELSFYPPGIFSPGQEAEFVANVLDWDRTAWQAAIYLMRRQPWDFAFTVFGGTDIASHFVWRPAQTPGAAHGGHPAAAGPAPDECPELLRVYTQADAFLDRLLQEAGDNTYVVVVSDHGFGPLEFYLHVNAWLEQRGYLRFKRTPPVLLKVLAYRLGVTPTAVLGLARRLRLSRQVHRMASRRHNRLESLIKALFLSLLDVDWSRTTAYSAGFGGPILLNLRGRQPEGIVEPGAEAEETLARLIDDLRAMRHPMTGDPVFGAIHRPADLYWGPFVDRAPDLIPEPLDRRTQGYGLHDFASNRWLERSTDRTGTHRMNGILLLAGPGVLAGHRLEGARLTDVAPTVLALMGIAPPIQMDGQVLLSAFDPVLCSELTLAASRPAPDTQDTDRNRSKIVLAEQEDREIRERLSALGYLG